MWRSAPVVQNVDPVGDNYAGRLQVSERDRDGALGQVVPWVIVEANDQDSRVVTAYSRDEIVQRSEVLVIPRQYRASVSDCPDQHSSVRD